MIDAPIERAKAYSIGSLGPWTLPPRVSCLQFVEERGIVPSGARRGKLSFEHRPYQREVFQAYDGRRIRHITLVWCSQSGKSTVVLNVLFFHVVNRPTAEMVVLPNKNSRNDFVDDRLRPAILGSREWVRELLTGHIDADLIQTKGRFRNGPLYLALAGSEADLAQRDCELVVNDEKDKQPRKTSREGSPDDQAEARTRTFIEPKIVNVSTPTSKEGPITRDFSDSDQRLWNVACPKCGSENPWLLSNLKREDRPIDPRTGRKRSLRLHALGVRRGEVAVWYEMPCCGHVVTGKRDKDRLNSGGRFVATHPEVDDHAGFRITAFDIPDESFESIMIKYMQAQHDERRGDVRGMRTFFNHWLAQPFEPKRRHKVAEAVVARIRHGTRRGFVPAGFDFVTMGVDVQGESNGVYWVAVAFRHDGPTAHVVDWGHIPGEYQRILGLLDEVEAREWQWQGSERKETAQYVFEDSGDGNMTLAVYSHCTAADDDDWGRVRPTKGDVTGEDFYRESRKENQPHEGLLVAVNSTLLKDTWNAWFERDPADPTCLTFPPEVRDDVDFQNQVTSEERGERSTASGVRVEWVAKGPNHYFDGKIYAIGAAIFAGLMENQPEEDGDSQALPPEEDPERRGGWLRDSRRGRSWLHG